MWLKPHLVLLLLQRVVNAPEPEYAAQPVRLQGPFGVCTSDAL